MEIGIKMSSSSPAGIIALDDHPFTIREKMRVAYCPSTVEDNPLLLIAKLCIREAYVSGLQIGNKTFKSYDELERAYASGEITPSDLKVGMAEAIIKILEPVRRKLESED